ncbi:MAG: phytanoyl-CoA dioxygenase family protein [Bacteroidetes bacterium]|nr:phytanoyl-CoA dioxygenase family protein [Bacteroidota bacterium]
MNDLKITQQEIDFFEENGYLVIRNLINEETIVGYQKIYNDFISGKIGVGANRRDLKGEDKNSKSESITQIMVPSQHFPTLQDSAYYQKISQIVQTLMGDDMEIDFDMFINKPPQSNAITPWHQDCAYWIDMPDKRAVSAWMPLNEATLDNGCMWYVPVSHKLPMRKHTSSAKNGALVCEGNENEAVYIELKPGSVVLHHGATAHYSRGNTTNSQRRAMIVNLRPKSMINYERERGFDHTGENKVRNENVK